MFKTLELFRPHERGMPTRLSVHLHAYAHNYSGRCVKALSILDIDAKARAAAALIAQGPATRLNVNRMRMELFPGAGQYRFFNRPVRAGERTLTHVLVVHRSVFDNTELPTVITDGDLEKDIVLRLAKTYAIPTLEAWHKPLYALLTHEKLIEPLAVWSNPDCGVWASLKGATATFRMKEDRLLEIIAKGIREGLLPIPEGPDAPDFDSSRYERIGDYLTDYAPVHARSIEGAVQPIHRIEEAIDPRIAGLKRIPYPAQAHAITAAFKALKTGARSIFLAGDMGTGKSIISLGVAHLLKENAKDDFRVLLMAPGTVVPKWIIAEIKTTLPWARVRTITSFKDVLAYRPGSGLEITIISRDRAKLGFDPWTCALWRRVKGTRTYAWHCPDCFEPLPHPKPIKDMYAGWDVLAEGSAPEDHKVPGTVKWKKSAPYLHKCPACGAVLRRPANKALGESKMRPRLHPARLMKKRLKGHFDLFVCDEIHQMRGDSGQGAAYGQLVQCARQTLNLTGTLTAGKAGDLYRLLERSDIRPLLQDGFARGEIAHFIAAYGALQEVRKQDTESGVFTGLKKERRYVREIAGISPVMFTKHLLDRSVFIELADLGLPLVEIKEKPVFIDLDPEHKKAYDAFARELSSLCRSASYGENPGVWSRYVPATINYADRPAEITVTIGKKAVVAPELPIPYSAKERRLVEDVTQELSEERGVIVFCHYTDTYGTDARLQQVLGCHGIESQVLKAEVAPEDRMEWLDEQAAKGVKVIISNMRLVEVGLDIIAYPTAIFYQGSYEVHSVRQASRRAWRIGQRRECRVLHYVAVGTQQQQQFENMLARRAHALLLEGRLDKTELVRYAKDDAFSALTKELASKVDLDDLAAKWKELAAKDMPDVTTVSEAEFCSAVEKAEEALIALTLSLCGVKPKPVTAPALKVIVLRADKKKRVAEGQLAMDFTAFFSENPERSEAPCTARET